MVNLDHLLPAQNPIDLSSNTDLTNLIKEVSARYKVDINDQTTVHKISAVIRQFMKLGGLFGEGDSIDTANLRKLKCLDLACGNGSPASIDDQLMAAMLGSHNRRMEPWLCRSLHQAGVDVTGVDLFYPRYEGKNGQREDWKFVQMDLTRPDGLQKHFRDKTFDVVVSTDFVLSERVHAVMTHQMLNAPQMVFLAQDNPQKYSRIVKDLLGEMRRVLKIEGECFLNQLKVERSQLKVLERSS